MFKTVRTVHCEEDTSERSSGSPPTQLAVTMIK